MTPGTERPVLTSLPLQVFLYFGGWWDFAFWIIAVCVFVYKGVNLPYPPINFNLEFFLLFLWLVVEPARIFLGVKGNRGESAAALFSGIFLSILVFILHIYYFSLQTFVLKIERVINAISIIFCAFQMLLSFLAGLKLMRHSKSP